MIQILKHVMPARTAALMAVALASVITAYSAQAIDWRFPVGVGYSSGIAEVKDAVKDYYRGQGFQVEDDYYVPVSVVFSPYAELTNGLGLGVSLGPPSFLEVTATSPGGENNDTSYIVPIGADIRYTFLRKGNVSPYLRAGVRYPIAGGEAIESSTVGAFGAVGAEFWRTKKVALGVELSYDSSEVKVIGGKNVKPNEFFISVSAVF